MTLAQKSGEPRESMRTRSEMKTARNSGTSVEKQSDLLERHALTMSALRLQTLHKIPGYYGDQSKSSGSMTPNRRMVQGSEH